MKEAFINDTGPNLTILPIVGKVLKSTEIQKVTNRYKDENKNEVEFFGESPLNMEYENNKQKRLVQITKRTDIAPYPGIDWRKGLKLTIGRIKLAENGHAEC